MTHGSWATHFFSIFNRSGLIFYLFSFDSSLCEAWEVLVKAYGKTFCSWLCALFLFFVLSLPSFVFLWYFLILALEKPMNKRSLFMFTIYLWFHRPFLQHCCHLFSDWKSLTYLITSDAETIWYLCHPNTLPLNPFQTCCTLQKWVEQNCPQYSRCGSRTSMQHGVMFSLSLLFSFLNNSSHSIYTFFITPEHWADTFIDCLLYFQDLIPEC